MTLALLALALLVGLCTSAHARQPTAPAALVDAFIDGGLLPPHQAPGVIHETLFGWSDPQQQYSMMVPEALEPGIVQIGENIAFEPFEIEPIWVFDLLTPAVQNDPSLVPARAWYGLMRSVVGEIPAAGYAIEVDGVTSLILVTTSANTCFGVELAAYMRGFPIADALTLSPTHRLSGLIDRIPSRTHFMAGELHADLEFPFAWICPDRAFQDEALACAICLGCVIANSAACPIMCAGDHWDTPGESFASCMMKCTAAQLRISNPSDAIADCLEGNCDELGAPLAQSLCGASCGGCAVLGKVAKWFDTLGDPPSGLAPRPIDWIWKSLVRRVPGSRALNMKRPSLHPHVIRSNDEPDSMVRGLVRLLARSRTLPEEDAVPTYVAWDLNRRMHARIVLVGILILLATLGLSGGFSFLFVYVVRPARIGELLCVMMPMTMYVLHRVYRVVFARILIRWYKSANPYWMRVKSNDQGVFEGPERLASSGPIEPWELEPANLHPIFR